MVKNSEKLKNHGEPGRLGRRTPAMLLVLAGLALSPAAEATEELRHKYNIQE